MASTITLKRQIASISGTRQITKALEMVSASKLRRAQAFVLQSREYRDMAYDLLTRLSTISEVEREPLFQKRTVKTRLYVVITSSTGLAGAYNANILKLLGQELAQDKDNHVRSQVIAVGSKAAAFVRRIEGVELMAAYPPFTDQPSANDIRPILTTVIEQYEAALVDEVRVLYTYNKSTIAQKVRSLQLLPATAPEAQAVKQTVSTFEPDVETVVAQVTTRLVEAQIWQGVIESMAAEHAMRMIATKNATDNANDLIKDYKLELNTARQAAITQELAEISGGAEALNG